MWSNNPELTRNIAVSLSPQTVLEFRSCRITPNSLKTPGKVRVSSRWFDRTKHPPHHTELIQTTLLIGGFRPSGQFRVSSGSFDLSEPPRTSVMEGRWRGTQACRAVMREFGDVRQDRTSTIHFDVGGGRLTAKFRVSSRWLYLTEPPRTTLIHRSCRTTPSSLKTAL